MSETNVVSMAEQVKATFADWEQLDGEVRKEIKEAYEKTRDDDRVVQNDRVLLSLSIKSSVGRGDEVAAILDLASRLSADKWGAEYARRQLKEKLLEANLDPSKDYSAA